MSGRTLVLFLVAILIAAAAVIIVKNRMAGGTEGAKVLVAAANIDIGSFVRADKQLGWVEWQGEISPSFITSQNFKIDDFNGAVARRPILAGEPVTLISVVRVNEGGFMSAVLMPGKRAVSIATSPTSGNAGFVFPGDHVDLILTHRITVKDGSADVLASETFIQDARVLAIDQMLANPENVAVVAKTMTLEVSPKQAEMVNVATNLGSISVSLRSLAAHRINETPAAPVQPPVAANDNQAGKEPAAVVPGTTSPAPVPTGASAVDAAMTGDVKPAEPKEPQGEENSVPPLGNYSTDNDVSKLMGNKSAVRAKVNVYHGSTTEEVDFNRGQK